MKLREPAFDAKSCVGCTHRKTAGTACSYLIGSQEQGWGHSSIQPTGVDRWVQRLWPRMLRSPDLSPRPHRIALQRFFLSPMGKWPVAASYALIADILSSRTEEGGSIGLLTVSGNSVEGG